MFLCLHKHVALVWFSKSFSQQKKPTHKQTLQCVSAELSGVTKQSGHDSMAIQNNGWHKWVQSIGSITFTYQRMPWQSKTEN